MQNTIAFVFPGQGSQSLGMLAEHLAEYPDMKNTFIEASDAVGYDVLELVSTGPEEKLSQTEYTQVAMLTADVALFRLYQQRISGNKTVMAGHSLGEYAALVAAESLVFSDAVKLFYNNFSNTLFNSTHDFFPHVVVFISGKFSELSE